MESGVAEMVFGFFQDEADPFLFSDVVV